MIALIGTPSVEPPLPTRELGRVLLAFCRSGSLWLNAWMQFLINIGWAFLITWLPTYLKEAKHVEPLAGGRMVTLVLACGMAGQLAGGLFAVFRFFGALGFPAGSAAGLLRWSKARGVTK